MNMKTATNQTNNDVSEKLSFLSDVLQIINTYLNVKQTSSDEIMKELQKQDNVYFESILKQLNNIDKRLERLECLENFTQEEKCQIKEK